MLAGKLRERPEDPLGAALAAALQALPPEAFELPEYERASRG
jgi:hypothetical protein